MSLAFIISKTYVKCGLNILKEYVLRRNRPQSISQEGNEKSKLKRGKDRPVQIPLIIYTAKEN